MDTKTSVPEATSQDSTLSGSSSFTALSLPFHDSNIHSSIEDNVLKVENNNTSGSATGSSDAGFLSGQEELDTVAKRPSVAEPHAKTPQKGTGGDNFEPPFLGSSEEWMPKSAVPIENASAGVDGYNEHVGDPRDGVLKQQGLLGDVDKGLEEIGDEGSPETGSNGKASPIKIEHEKLEVGGGELKSEEGVKGLKTKIVDGQKSVLMVDSEEVGGLADNNVILGGGTERKESRAVVPADVQLVEGEGVKLPNGVDSVMDSTHVDMTDTRAAYVGELENTEETDFVGVNNLVEGSLSLGNGFNQISHKVEEPVYLSVAYDENVEFVDVDNADTVEVEPCEREIDVLVKDNHSTVDSVTTESMAKGSQNEEELEAQTGVGSKEVIPLGEIEVEADHEANVNKPEVETAADVVEHGPGDKVDGDSGGATQSVDIVAESSEGTADGSELVSSGEVGAADRDASLSLGIFAGTRQATAVNNPEFVENGRTCATAEEENLEGEASSESLSPEVVKLPAVSDREFHVEADDEEKHYTDDEGESEGSEDGETEDMIFGSSEAARQFLEELEQGSAVGSHSGAEISHDQSQKIDGQIVTDSDEEVDTDEEGEGKELFDSAALAALLKAATGAGSDGGSITVTSQDGSRLFSVERPAGLGSSLRSVKPASRSIRPNFFNHSNLMTGGDSENNLSEAEKKKLEKLQQIRVKFLRLVQRLGHSPEDPMAAQVLYRLALIAGRQTGQLFSLDSAKRAAVELEAEGKDDINFSLNILVLGKTGVGKSATINSIFGEEKVQIHAFEPATCAVREVTGVVDGVKIRVIDTPGLKSSAMEEGANRKVLSSVKKVTKKCPPDIVLYVDRLDTQTRDLNDLPLLKTITSSLGSSIWRNAIVALTHAASAPPDGPSGSPLSYEVFVAQRSHVVQQSIGQAVGDLRLMNPSLMNPVSLVENHPSCRKNRDGEKVLPNGQCWRPQILLLCYSMKIASEASSLSKPQDPFDHRKLFGFRVRSPPLPYLLSWLLQSRTHPKLSADQGGDNGDSDIDLDDMYDSDQEDGEDEYDQLPPFKPLRKAQLAKLSKEQRKAYFEEYDYRVKLLQKKQWREELRRMKEMKKKGNVAPEEYAYMGEEADQENGAPAAVPVPLPDMVLPPSFDGDNPAYRYRFLEPTSQFLARPVLDTHGWDHDCGYDGVNVEHSLAVASRFPAAVAVQVTKDKKEFNIHLDSSIAAKYGENGSTMAGFDIQNVGKQLAYILRGETKFRNFKRNKTAAGVSVTFLGENVATGVKVEDQIALGKRLVLVGSTGTVRSQGDSAYGANLEVRLREADFPIGQDQSSLGLSLVKWRGDLALGANLQSQFSIGRNSKLAVRAGLNNKLSGQITVRTSSSDQLQIALVALLPIATAIYKSLRPGVSESYSMY